MHPVSHFRLPGLLTLLLVLAGLSLTACNDNDDNPDPNTALIEPAGTPSVPFGEQMAPQMRAVIEQFVSYNTPPLPTLSPGQARMAPSVTDAVRDLLKKNNRSAPTTWCPRPAKRRIWPPTA